MKRSESNYMRRAQAEFLDGTGFKTPFEAVQRGVKMIEQWCDCVETHRQDYLERSNRPAVNKISVPRYSEKHLL